MDIPDIFVFSPDYENIFLEMFELFSLPRCDKATHINITEVFKAILEPDEHTEDGEILMDFANNMQYIRKIVTDVNDYLHGRPVTNFPIETIRDKRFISGVVEIMCKANPALEDVLAMSF